MFEALTTAEARSASPTESLLQDLLDMCGQPIGSPRLISPGVGLPVCSSTPIGIVSQAITQTSGRSELLPPPSHEPHKDVPDSSSVGPIPAPFTHQSVSSPTVSSTTRNYLVGSQCSTPQQQRVNRSDLLYSPIFQSPDSSSSPAGAMKIPQYTSYPTGGPPTGHDQDLLLNSPELGSPMLQEALQAEARPNVLPLNLLQATLPPSGQFQAPQIPLSARSGMLQVALMHLEKSHRSKAFELQRFYQIQSAKIEADRVAQLCTVRHVPSVLTIVNQYYDMQHHALIDNIDLQVRCLRYQFSTSAPTAKSESNNKGNLTQPARKEAKAIKQRRGKAQAS